MLISTAYAQDRAPRAEKIQGVSFHTLSASPATGYNQATLDGQTYYVAPKAMIVADQVSSIQSNASSITLNGDFSGASKAGQLGVLIDGQLMAVGSLAMQNGQATITGMSASQTQRISNLLSRKPVSPTGAAFSVVPAGQANGEYVFDVFLQNVPELRTYQVKLQATGGTAGSLTMTDVRIDESRPDYVFTGNEAVKAADLGGSRLGGTLFNGTVAVAAPKYVGTWRFRASSDAAGTFNVGVISGGESFISNMQNQMLPVGSVGATVQIGAKSRLSD
jgi:hypothetical protein